MNKQAQNFAPFQCSYSPSVPEMLNALNCTIAISTYQAGKVIFLSAVNDDKLIQLPRSFVKAMGIALKEDKMAVACKDEVIVLRDSPALGAHYPKKPQVYDAMYMPRSTYYTGALDIHDVEYCEDGLCAVNTHFSCIIKIDENHSFTPIWKPDFITKITNGDHCHLNGMAVENGQIKYATAFATTDAPRAWTKSLQTSGVLIDYSTQEIILDKLGMPHSPRIHNGLLYVLCSATGELIEMNSETKVTRTVLQYDGFLRGMDFYEDFAFVGMSKIRKNSSSFGHLNIAEKSNVAGVLIVHLSTGSIVGKINYTSSVDEIYDVKILRDKKRPSILNTLTDDHKLGLTTPDTTYWSRTQEKSKNS